MKNIGLFIVVMLIMGTGLTGAVQAEYQPTVESLKQKVDAPEWFQDAKYGIYFHWGVYSVPAFSSEWYPRLMYDKNNPCNPHHIKTWGEPTKFGYHDFVPMFKAEKFNAEDWARLFVRAGAKFAGPVAEHHDGFSMWASKVTPWNAAEKGPKRDIVGELEKAIHGYGMRFITTFHHARNSLYKPAPNKDWTGHYEFVKKNYPSILNDPLNAILYGYMPRDQFVQMWKDKLVEVIDGYHPDIIWFDSWLETIPEKTRLEFAAYYANQALKWNKEVVIVRKQNDMPIDFTVLDHEKARTSGASERVWMTDDTISTGSWCYTTNLKIKPTGKVLHAMIDTVSKNGIVLLNISPMADGTIPEDQKSVLMEIGDWMRANGEAIYATRPWITYGEGPTKEPEGGFKSHGKFLKLEYSAKDIRYTRSKDGKAVYAICLGIPDGQVTLGAAQFKASRRARVQLLNGVQVPYSIDGQGHLVIDAGAVQAKIADQYAVVFKLSGFNATK